jgi:hypothetical protein
MPANAKMIAAQIEAVDALVAKFRERWEFEEDDLKMVEDFKASIAGGKVKAKKTKGKGKAKKADGEGSEGEAPAEEKPKRTRPPSAYNLFVKENREKLTAAGFKGKDMIREAAKLWNERERPNKDEE